MTYAVSNLHGCFDKFKKLLDEINFSDNDVMYVLGDIVDIGDEPIELLCDLSMRYNVIPIVGEHDMKAFELLTAFDDIITNGATPDGETMARLTDWIREGGAKTMEGFKALDSDMREGILEYLGELSLYEEVEVRGKKYLLLHAGIADFDVDTPLDDYMPEDFISESADPERVYFDDVTMVVGHTPTYSIDGATAGRIYRGESCIFIDCGAAFGETLGCLCLDTMDEFYI